MKYLPIILLFLLSCKKDCKECTTYQVTEYYQTHAGNPVLIGADTTQTGIKEDCGAKGGTTVTSYSDHQPWGGSGQSKRVKKYKKCR